MIGDQDEIERAWLELKWEKFSASNMHKLLSKGVGTEMFGKGAKTYIEEIARQMYTTFNTDDSVETYAMKKGKVNEPEAFAYLYQMIGFEGLMYHGGAEPIFKMYCPHSGTSPDVTAPKPDGTYSFGAELKAPEGKAHWEYLMTVKNAQQLKEKMIEYYTQCQFAMMTFKCPLWLWTSYNSYYPIESRMLIVEIQEDINFQMNLDIRLKCAIKEAKQLVEVMRERFKPML